MIKTILVCVDSSHYSSSAVDLSVWLAKALKAGLHILSVADNRLLQGPWLADLSGVAGVQPYESILPKIQEVYEKKAQVAVDAASAKAKGIQCKKEVRSGSVIDLILEVERSSELVVLGQKGEGHEATGEWMGSIVERVVRKSIKPCLVVPLHFKPIQSILVAYDGSTHANHALYAALDWVVALKAKLTILTIEGHRDEEQKSWALKEALEIVYKQGLNATPMALHGLAEEKILEVAADQKHDLIVMGAYGHTRLRELILGSVTSHVIRKSPIPVMLTR